MSTPTPYPEASGFPSEEDIETAQDILLDHPPRQVIRWFCACGKAYPCWDVRFAHVVMDAVQL